MLAMKKQAEWLPNAVYSVVGECFGEMMLIATDKTTILIIVRIVQTMVVNQS
jgi:hypothetical protein